jgi:o-succinylbenzoate synthase
MILIEAAKIGYIAERNHPVSTALKLQTEYHPYTLRFRFPAGTSRGVLREKRVFFVRISDAANPKAAGIGECGPLPGLSPDDLPDYEELLTGCLGRLRHRVFEPTPEGAMDLAAGCVPSHLPSVRFGLQSALLDLVGGGRRMLFANRFSAGEQSIPINGLVWMGDAGFMANQVEQKLREGYACIKMKVGAIQREQELALLQAIRKRFSEKEIVIRLDANGAFPVSGALELLKEYGEYGIHSIEQPIRPGLWEAMESLCRLSPVPVALDEELIGHTDPDRRRQVLEALAPQFIVLKPSLLGGFAACNDWIRLAGMTGCGWWITSMLEANIGLNAIAQYTGGFETDIQQGLGTGQLYTNNITSPLIVSGGHIRMAADRAWDLSGLDGWIMV